MAFDLVRLQLLQEALVILKGGMPSNALKRPVRSICGALTIASIRYEYAATPLCRTLYSGTINNIINKSVKIRQNCSALITLEAYEAYSIGYLWPLSKEYAADRVKYLERLIEDEMSGTYFMDMNHGI